jgi:hypothetical protein
MGRALDALPPGFGWTGKFFEDFIILQRGEILQSSRFHRKPISPFWGFRIGRIRREKANPQPPALPGEKLCVSTAHSLQA